MQVLVAGGILVVAPLLHFLRGHLACRIVFVDRNLDGDPCLAEHQMLVNRGVEHQPGTPARGLGPGRYGQQKSEAAHPSRRPR
jgi:hypothetical protein